MYNLYFCINNELVEFSVYDLSDESLHNTVSLFSDFPRHFVINETETSGRLYYSPMKYLEFKVSKK